MINSKIKTMISEMLDVELQSYELVDDGVKITLDSEMMLNLFLTSPTYYLSKVLIDDNYNWNNLRPDSKKLLLIILNNNQDGHYVKTEFVISPEDLAFELMLLDLYDLESPELFEGFYIFRLKYVDRLKSEFKRKISSLVNQICIKLPDIDIPYNYINILEGIRKCNPFITINKVGMFCEMSENEVVEVLWDMAKKGFLRIRD